MKPWALVRLALAGTRSDTARVALTGLSAGLATLAYLAALTVVAIPTVEDNGSRVSPQYRHALIAEAGLRPGVVVVLVLLTIPVLALAGQCALLGAPSRDRRLAAIRLAGGSPGQAIAIAATETGLASVLGTAAGVGAYFGGRELLHRPGADGKLPLPTDVVPPAWWIAAVCLGIPAVAMLFAVLQLRRVVVTPFGVVRRVRDRPPMPWPGVLIIVGLVITASIVPLSRQLEGDTPALLLVLLFLGLACATVGVVAGTGWISYRTGWLMHRFGRRPATLLAARRLMADPWNGSRTLAGLLACLVFGGGAAGVRSSFATDFQVEREAAERSAPSGVTIEPRDTDFYFGAFNLINIAIAVGLVIAAGGLVVALAESIVSRRRSYAALVATGVPRSTLAKAVMWQSLTPAVLGIATALAVGVGLSRGLFGDASRQDSVVREVPVPLDDLALLGAGAVVAVLAVVGAGLLFLRASTAIEELRV
ncbi:FtsX-like permease family protein [Micromonospora sp. CPCC 206061]|uniref:FtsX-like permease family protein n=1 Tax=Micromonospora sp. CPCC 206061 TaxID=3122410 RepID=UPI002FF2486D